MTKPAHLAGGNRLIETEWLGDILVKYIYADHETYPYRALGYQGTTFMFQLLGTTLAEAKKRAREHVRSMRKKS